MPALRKNGAVMQLMVDGKAFIMLAGELHNSSASSREYMEPIWKKLAAMNLNTVIGTVSWELLEPQEGTFDFALVDDQIRQARAHNMRLVLIWFGTWKNAVASYVPMWVKADLTRFPRVLSRDGVGQEELTPLGEESLKADAKAYRALMRHIRAVDPQHTVIMMQVENEAGKLHDSRDRSPLAEAAWNGPVPPDLLNYLAANRATLHPALMNVWGASGFKTSGTWPEVFGSGPQADEIFMAWYIATYIGKVTEAGKAELPIPMYANAWLVQHEHASARRLSERRPEPARARHLARGGTADRPAGAGYLPPGLQGGVRAVHSERQPAVHPRGARIGAEPDLGAWPARGAGLFAVRHREPSGRHSARTRVSNARWDGPGHREVPDRRKGDCGRAGLGGRAEPGGDVRRIQAHVRVQRGRARGASGTAAGGSAGAAGGPGTTQENRSFALIVNTAPDEFVIAGQGFTLTFAPDTPGPKIAGIGIIDEGRYENGVWKAGRRINGDENGGGTRMRMAGQRIEDPEDQAVSLRMTPLRL